MLSPSRFYLSIRPQVPLNCPSRPPPSCLSFTRCQTGGGVSDERADSQPAPPHGSVAHSRLMYDAFMQVWSSLKSSDPSHPRPPPHTHTHSSPFTDPRWPDTRSYWRTRPSPLTTWGRVATTTAELWSLLKHAALLWTSHLKIHCFVTSKKTSLVLWKPDFLIPITCFFLLPPQYAVESQIRLRGFDPRDSMLLLAPRPVLQPHSSANTWLDLSQMHKDEKPAK